MKLEDEIKQKSFQSEFHRLAINVMFTSAWIQSSHLRLLKPFGLTTQQYNVLRILRGQQPNPASVSLIQERMLDKNSNASRLVDKLVAKNLIERKTCPSDRRQVDIRITSKGIELLAVMDTKLAELETSYKGITIAEAAQVSDLLDKFRG
jgi:DNA-binding MarR family transcriptional regulator